MKHETSNPLTVKRSKMDSNKAQLEYFWKKKEFVSFVLCILVFMIHISSFAPYSSSNDAVAEFNKKAAFFFKESITRFAVPMFFILSAIAFFRDYSNKKYFSKIKSRFFSLCIPYLIWNTIWMIFEIVCSYTVISSFFVGREKFSLSVANILKSIFLAESNVPFWFILYLMVFVFISPLFDLLVRNKYVGITALVALSIVPVFEIPVIENLKIDAFVFYLLGAMIGKHWFAAVTKKTSRTSQIVSVIFLLVYIFAKNVFPTYDYFALPFIKIVVFTMAVYSLWSMVDLFIDNISLRPMHARSFPVYAMHINVSAVIYKICYLLLPKNGYMAIPNFLITLILTITLINVFCIIFERYLPSAYALVMGKGLKKIEKKERK